MDIDWKSIIWRQFGAAIDMLENALTACPDELWAKPANSSDPFTARWYEYWYLTFHTLFWLDFYLSETREGFAPPAPFGLEEMDPKGAFPPRVYTKDELRTYLEFGRENVERGLRHLQKRPRSSVTRPDGWISAPWSFCYTICGT
ncbi:MAG: hypothetical protein E4G91_03280, partial [Candidatus Zixiibacteriota bacterium]